MNNNEERNEKGFQGGIGRVHIIILAVILVVLAFSIFKLVKWNMGTVKTEGDTGANLEIEVLDQIFLLPNEKKEGHEFDDTETILFLGNDILTYYDNENGFVQQVEKKLGAKTINGGYPGTTVALKNGEYSDEYPLDAFSFSNVVDSLVSGDFSRMENAAGSLEDSAFSRHTEQLKELDMNTVDTLVIFYDAQDYLNLRIGMNPDDENDPITYSGALHKGIQAFQEKYPFIRIVCMSFPMCYAYDSTGALVSGDRFDFGNGRLTTYLQFMIDNSGATGVSFVDNYYGTIDEDNSAGWLLDNVHVNAACNEYMADHFIRVIYPKKDN
ncbi:MAG: hypothetical protein K6G10_09130 [Butyrivibrio sp.]|nr:hypothetical protein [Butyrivibrio sp.]